MLSGLIILKINVFVMIVGVIGSSFFADKFHTKLYNIARLVDIMFCVWFINMKRNIWNRRAANVLASKEEVHFLERMK